jgi:hypothetical protein
LSSIFLSGDLLTTMNGWQPDSVGYEFFGKGGTRCD